MTDASLFWAVFTAMLAAIMLGGAFWGALLVINRHETDGTERQIKIHHWIGLLMPLAFLVMGVFRVL